MFELAVNKVKKYMDSIQVFEDITFNIFSGEKVGIVGDNGAGKSTLLKLIAGKITLNRDDRGDLFIPREAKVGYLEQIPNYSDDLKVKDVLNLAFKEVKDIERQMKDLEEQISRVSGEELERGLKRYSRLQEHYVAKSGYDIEEKLSKVCTGLKINKSFLEKSFNILSGGEKTTVMLGKILLEDPDILLLDEPTNHLDMESCEWLEEYLKNYRGIVVIVSHDRYFLDNVVTKIIEIEDMMSETYKGNYSDYTKQKEENMMIQFNQYKEQQKKIAAMEKAIKDLRDWAARADNAKFFKRAASMQKALDKMVRIEKPKLNKINIKLNFNETERSGNEVIKVRNLSKSYDDKILFKDGNMDVRYKERTGLIGTNGCGKTTFIRMLLGEEPIDDGTIDLGESVKYAYLPQNIKFNDEGLTILEEFRNEVPMLEGKAREYLSKYMFFGSDVFKKIKHLSGGERIRLKLSELLFKDINLLILDEPTNHLDINSINTLEEALDNFDGTVFFISHDRYFLNKISSKIIEVDNGEFKTYEGNYDFYKSERNKIALKNENKMSDNSQNKEEKVNCAEDNQNKNNWKLKKDEQREKRKLDNKIKKLEEKIALLEEKIKEIDTAILETGSDYEKAGRLCKDKTELENELTECMEQWEECFEK